MLNYVKFSNRELNGYKETHKGFHWKYYEENK